MSRTRLKNGQRVFDGAVAAGAKNPGVMRGCFLTKHVVQESGLSKPTVLKYLRIMEQEGCVRSVEIGRGALLFQLIGGNKNGN